MTVEGKTNLLERPFFVIATQNPIEYEGTYPLPEAQLDRFLLRTGVGYLSREHEWEVLERRIEREVDDVELSPRSRPRDLARDATRARAGARGRDPWPATSSISSLPRARRPASRSARALEAPLRCSSSRAEKPRSSGRDYVVPEDVKAVAVAALAHRLTLRPELWVQNLRAEDIVLELLEKVPTPAVEPPALVKRAATAKLRVYPALAAVGVLAGLALGRPELVALGAPFAVLAAVGVSLAQEPRLQVRLVLGAERQVEGEEVLAEVEVSATRSVGRLYRAARASGGPADRRSEPLPDPACGRGAAVTGAPTRVRALGRVRSWACAAAGPGRARLPRLRSDLRLAAAAQGLPER